MTVTRRPMFARIYVRMAAAAQEKGEAEHRRELLSGLRGRVLEVGCGHGLNFPSYPDTVSEVVAVEPEEHLRAMAVEAANEVSVSVRVLAGVAEALPLAGASVDAVVASLMLCSVPNQARTLREMHRVLRVGGVLRFYEHVVAESRVFSSAQRLVDPLWSRMAGGCHTSRDTVAAIEQADFSVEGVRRFDFRTSLLGWPATPHVIGTARRMR